MDKFEIKLQKIKEKYQDIIKKLSDPDTVKDQNLFRELSKKRSELDELVSMIDRYFENQIQYNEAKEMLDSEDDNEMIEMAKAELKELDNTNKKIIDDLKVLMLPRDPNEDKNVILEIRAGTGGDEAALFVADLFRMYSRLCEKRKWKMQVIEANDTGIGGYKEVVLFIKGDRVYNFLKYESGVHRVQRVPETESQGRVHTSAVTVAVLPEVEDTEVEINKQDLRIDVYRASGAGGQHVNKTESAVRITHLPTNTVVTCQDESSQIKNKQKAMKVLMARLYEAEKAKRDKELASERKSMIGGGDRSEKIRTYNFPQSRFTDHRINLTIYKLTQVLNGELDEVIDSLIVYDREQLLKNQEI